MPTRFKVGKDHDWLEGMSDEEKKMAKEMYKQQQEDKKGDEDERA